MFKSRRFFSFLLFSFIVVSAVFSLSLSHLSQKRVTLKQKAAEEQPPSPISEWVPIDLISFNQKVDQETAELTKELSNLPSLNLSAKEKTQRQDVLQRSLQIKQITKEEHNLMDENQDRKIDYEEFNKRDAILAEKVYQLRHTTISTLDNGLYDEQMVRITTDNLHQHTSPNNNVLRVFVEAGVYQDIYAYLVQYRTDVQRDWNYDVRFYLCNNCIKETNTPGPVGIKNLLRVQGTIGTVFVGDLPTAWYQIVCWPPENINEVYPIDLYYMDLDGTWDGEVSCGSEICFTTHTGNLYPEIFFGRLTAPVEAEETRLINNYFRKNHNYRRGGYLLAHQSLNYIDDPWENATASNPDSPINVSFVYPSLETIAQPTVSVNDFKSRWKTNNYEHLFLTSHSCPEGHWLGQSFLWWDEVRNFKPNFDFYFLNACSAARYTSENYIAGWDVFQESSYGLVSWGATKRGGMFSTDTFYRALQENNHVGLAYKRWYLGLGNQGYAKISDRCWVGYQTLVGDPTLKVSLPNSPTAVPTPRLLHNVDQPMQNGSYSSPFDFSGWTIWENGQRIEQVEFYMDLPRGQAGRYGVAVTDQFDRSDLCNLNPLYCRAGWKWRFNPSFLNPGPHKLHVYAYDFDVPQGYVGSPVIREFIVAKPTPTPTPTPPCGRPGPAGVISGPGEGERINYGDLVLKIIDGSPPNSCFPHDVVFSIWQNNIKKISSSWIEDVLPSARSQYEWRVNPLLGTEQFPPGTYQWRANLKNTANLTCPTNLILRVDFTVCARPTGPRIAELMFGGRTYQEGTATVFEGEEILVRVRDDSNSNSCFPHEVFLGIWPEGAIISPGTAIRDSNWQVGITNQYGVFPPNDFWRFSTANLARGNYQLAAIFKNNSLDRNKQYGSPDSMSIGPQIIPFQLVEKPSCSGVGVCSGSCPQGFACRAGGDNYCDCF